MHILALASPSLLMIIMVRYFLVTQFAVMMQFFDINNLEAGNPLMARLLRTYFAANIACLLDLRRYSITTRSSVSSALAI